MNESLSMGTRARVQALNPVRACHLKRLVPLSTVIQRLIPPLNNPFI